MTILNRISPLTVDLAGVNALGLGSDATLARPVSLWGSVSFDVSQALIQDAIRRLMPSPSSGRSSSLSLWSPGIFVHRLPSQEGLQAASEIPPDGDPPGSRKTADQDSKRGGDAMASYHRGVENGRLGRLDEAIADFDRAIELDPTCAAAYLNRGLARQKLHRFFDAFADYDCAIELNPSNAEAYRRRATVKVEIDRYKEALADYDRAIELDPKHAPTYLKRGLTREMLGLFAEAIADFERVIELNPYNVGAYVGRGVVKEALGHLDEAITDYERALDLDPDDSDAYGHLLQAQERLRSSIS